jgi:hypothetical protein
LKVVRVETLDRAADHATAADVPANALASGATVTGDNRKCRSIDDNRFGGSGIQFEHWSPFSVSKLVFT